VKTHAIRLVESSPGAYFVSYDGELILESRHPLNEAAGYLLERKFAKPRDCLLAYRSDGELLMGGQVAWLACDVGVQSALADFTLAVRH
jgi:hypothetical protein